MTSINSSIENDSLFRSSFSSASSLIALQLFSRVFTFTLNQALFRLASPRAYGTAAIQFELMLSTILFLSREGVRNALLRVKKAKAPIRNIFFIPLILGFPLALTTSYLYARFAGSEARSQPYFNNAIGIYALAALTELLSEPMHNMAMAELRTGVRVRAEGLGIISRTIVTFLMLLYDAKEGGGRFALLAFAGGQLAYGVSLLFTYLAHYGTRYMWPIVPRQSKIDRHTYFFEPEILRLSLTMTAQSVLKHFLTEGDKVILSWFSPLKDQGGYAIAINYGSLVARIVFQPVEEASRVFFSKTLVTTSAKPATDTSNHQSLHQAATALISLLSVQAALSVLLLVFGTAYMPLALHILLPQQYLSTSAPQVLTAWVWYIPVLAFNGGMEAFFSSVATPLDLNRQSRWMGVFSVIYISAAVTLYNLNFGDTALVYANIINLSVRIIYSALFISSYFEGRGAAHLLKWNGALPDWRLWLVAIISTAVVRFSGRRLDVLTLVRGGGRVVLLSRFVLIHVALGAFMSLVCITTWWMSSGRYMYILKHRKSE